MGRELLAGRALGPWSPCWPLASRALVLSNGYPGSPWARSGDRAQVAVLLATAGPIRPCSAQRPLASGPHGSQGPDLRAWTAAQCSSMSTRTGGPGTVYPGRRVPWYPGYHGTVPYPSLVVYCRGGVPPLHPSHLVRTAEAVLSLSRTAPAKAGTLKLRLCGPACSQAVPCATGWDPVGIPPSRPPFGADPFAS